VRAGEILADPRTHGIELRAEGSRLRVRPVTLDREQPIIWASRVSGTLPRKESYCRQSTKGARWLPLEGLGMPLIVRPHGGWSRDSRLLAGVFLPAGNEGHRSTSGGQCQASDQRDREQSITHPMPDEEKLSGGQPVPSGGQPG